jgi:hypothetical protein
MMNKLVVLVAGALLLAACESTPPAPPPPPPAPPVAAPSYMVFFDWDSTRLNQTAMGTIGQAAASFKSTGSASITAEGHTDTSGSASYNMALSLRRANTVKDALVAAGVPAAAIVTVGKGEEGLLVPTGDGVREPQNRRVVIFVAGGQASAQVDDQTYCKRLSATYRNTHPQTATPNNPVPVAMAQCDAGNPGPAIPVLEKSLIDDKVPLPSRAP